MSFTKNVFRFFSTALCGLGSLAAQQGPSPAVLRVGCETCPVTLRIVADMDLSVNVDGEKVGPIVRDAGKSVQVGFGQHLIVAESGKLRWETKLTVGNPGQMLVKTDLGAVEEALARRAEAKAQADADARKAKAEDDAKKAATDAAIRRWAGHWEGEASAKDYVDGGPTYTRTKETLTIDIDSDGGCSIVATWSDTFYYRGGPGDPPTEGTRTGSCSVVDQRSLRLTLGEFSDVAYRSTGTAIVKYTGLGGPMTINLEQR